MLEDATRKAIRERNFALRGQILGNEGEICVDCASVDADNWAVIAFLPKNKLHPYVVWYSDGKGYNFRGDYCENLEDAIRFFKMRVPSYPPIGEES